MASIYDQYIAYGYGIPFGTFGIIFIIISILHRRTDWFLLNTILGVDWKDTKDDTAKTTAEQKPEVDTPKESTNTKVVSTYLYIDFDVDEEASIPPLSCLIRFFSDFLVSAILAIFTAIIFESLIITRRSIRTGGPCPDFNAECFGTLQGQLVGPFNCTNGDVTNFTVDSANVQCLAWVYKNKNINDVLDTIGTCGGLLGLVASIVPLIYYLSYYKNNCILSCLCMIFPLSTLAAGGFTLWYTLPEGPSNLTIITFAVVISMTSIGWFWAFYRSCRRNRMKTNKDIRCCCGHRFFCVRRYKFYPFCCIYRHWIRYCCKNYWQNKLRKHCDEEDRESNETVSALVVKVVRPAPSPSYKKNAFSARK